MKIVLGTELFSLGPTAAAPRPASLHAKWSGQARNGTQITDPDPRNKADAIARVAATATAPSSSTPPDPITGLHGRRGLRQLLKSTIESVESETATVSVLVIGIDRFKRVNDHFGHEAGDEILRILSRRISKATGYSLPVGRLGGDEFVGYLLEPTMGGGETLRVARSIRDAVSRPIIVHHQEIFCTCSIGLASYPEDASEVTGLIGSACAALDRAKQRGGNQLRFYSPSLCERDSEALLLESALHRAMENDELAVNYQPRVDVQSGRIVGAEALARWENAKFGAVPPDRFIPIAERSGLIHDLSDQVLRDTCLQYREWVEQGAGLELVSVNLSPCQLQRPGLAARIRRIIEECGMDPQLLEFEVTETTLLKNPDTAARAMCELKEAGVKLALDDFGTGYSSLYHLRRFPIDTLKIDCSFIEALNSDYQTFVIVEGTISMAHKMGLSVVAEGVSTSDQHKSLVDLACDQFQGNLFSVPLEGEIFGELLGDRHSGASRPFTPSPGSHDHDEPGIALEDNRATGVV